MGPFPGNWLAARIADFTPDLQVLLSCGSTVVSFHSWQSFSASFFHVRLGLPAPTCPQSVLSTHNICFGWEIKLFLIHTLNYRAACITVQDLCIHCISLSFQIFKSVGHHLEEIRIRALENILSKLEHKLICDSDLIQERHLFIRLLEWFNFPKSSRHADILNLLLQLSQVRSNIGLHVSIFTDGHTYRYILKYGKVCFIF